MISSFKFLIKSVVSKVYKIHCEVMLYSPIEFTDALPLYLTHTLKSFKFNIIKRSNQNKIK